MLFVMTTKQKDGYTNTILGSFPWTGRTKFWRQVLYLLINLGDMWSTILCYIYFRVAKRLDVLTTQKKK